MTNRTSKAEDQPAACRQENFQIAEDAALAIEAIREAERRRRPWLG